MNSNMNPCIAALDVGTSSVKVCLFSLDMQLLARSVQEYRIDARGDRVEAEGEIYLTAVKNGMKDALTKAAGYRVAAIGVTTQGETFAPVDAEGTLLRPFIVWLDGRAEEQAEKLRAEIPEMEFYRTTGLPEISGALPLAKLMWLKENQPEIYEKTHKFLLVEDYLLHYLTGRFVSEKALQTSTGWFSLQTDGLWRKGLEAAGLDETKLPEILECGEVAGCLTEKTARELGLEPGIPVVTGAMDQTAAALAGGCVRPGAVTETTGSALVLAACTDTPTFAEGHHVTVYRHAFPGKYIYLPIGNTGGMALKWFRDEFCRDLPGGENGFNTINRLVSEVPAGCEGLVFLPFLSGSVDPDNCPEATGCFFGARLSSTRAHFARSVMESIAFLVRDFFEMLENLGCPVETVTSLGGGSRSEVWLQMKADVCGRGFRAARVSETTAMGAALLAGWGAGLIEKGTIPETAVSNVCVPNEGNRENYEKAYTLYKKLYSAVKPLY